MGEAVIEEKDLYVFEIAWIVGFSEITLFHRKFKKKFGYSPIQRNTALRGNFSRKDAEKETQRAQWHLISHSIFIDTSSFP